MWSFGSIILLLSWIGWMIPGAYFWQISQSLNIILPLIPQSIWMWPGQLWVFSPVLHIISTLLVGGLILFLHLRFQIASSKWIVGISIFLFSILLFVHYLWGSAVISAA